MEKLRETENLIFIPKNKTLSEEVLNGLLNEGYLVVYCKTNNETKISPEKQHQVLIIDYSYLDNKMTEMGLSDGSITTYTANIQRVLKSVFNTFHDITTDNLKEYEKIIKLFKKETPLLKKNKTLDWETDPTPTYSTLKNLLNSFSWVYKIYDIDFQPLEGMFKELGDLSIIEKTTTPLKEEKKLKINAINYDKIKAKMENEKDPLKRLLGGFVYYLKDNFQRYDAFFNANIYYNDEDIKDNGGNYFLLDKNLYVINCQKTAKTTGQVIIEIPQELSEMLKEYLLFGHNIIYNGSRGAFQKVFTRYFGFGAQDLRKKCASELQGTTEEIFEQSKKMCHSASVHMRDYKKSL